MSNYYEILSIEPTATQREIETQLDNQYNRWRRLSTHHDAAVVDEANKALRTIEQIRDTLMDSNKRAAYDAGIGVGGFVGGRFGVSPRES